MELFQKFSDGWGSHRGIPKLFRNEDQRKDLFLKISYRRGTNKRIPKLFRNEEKQTDLFQNISDQMRTNRFDSEIEEENSETDEGSSFFGTQAKSKGFDPKKIEVLTLLVCINLKSKFSHYFDTYYALLKNFRKK